MRFPYKVKDTKSIQRNFDYLQGILSNFSVGGSSKYTNYRELVGVVNGATGATISSPTGGWTCTRTGTGQYTVTFDVPFSTVPAVMVTFAELAPMSVASPMSCFVLPTASGFTLNIKNPGVAFYDGNFSFSAVGKT